MKLAIRIKQRNRLIGLLVAGIVCLFTTLPLNAQCPAENKAFKSGEHVMYDLYFNWKFIWVKAGIASLTTNATTRKGAEEGKRYTVDEAWFSYKDGVSHVRQSRSWLGGRVDTMSYSDSRCIFDMLSILAQARSYDPKDYKIGQKIRFPMATGRKVEEQTLIYRGKENITANNDTTYRCLVFSFVEYVKDGNKEKEKEVITFFVSDDKNHLPIRLDLYLNFGSAKAFLTSVRGNRYPLTCIVED